MVVAGPRLLSGVRNPVRKEPGSTTVTRMPSGASSPRSASVMASTANFEAP